MEHSLGLEGLKGDASFLYRFWEQFLRVGTMKDIPVHAIHWLAKPEGRRTLEVLMDRVLSDWREEHEELHRTESLKRSSHREIEPAIDHTPFSTVVIYAQPSFEQLQRQFSSVSGDYANHPFHPMARCKHVARERTEVLFEYIHLGRSTSISRVLAEMDRRGLRPALYEELLGFAEQFPDEQRQFPIIAIGSRALIAHNSRIPYLWCDESGRSLEQYWIGDRLCDYCRFLAVRLPSANQRSLGS